MAKKKSLSSLGFSAYQIYSDGKIYNTERKQYMAYHINNSGYARVSLTHDNKDQVNRLVHVLVATLFVENPKNLPEVNHKDNDKLNNKASNLEWVDRSTNITLMHAAQK